MQRIAILLTNNDTSEFAQHFPHDGDKVVQLLQTLRPEWQLTVVPVMEGIFPSGAKDFDAYIITGSPASVNDESLPWVGQLLTFIRAVDAARQPLIGLCFGHQAVARALGGQVARHAAGWGLGTATTHWQHSRPWMKPAQSTTTLMAAHNEQVTRMPEGAECLGGSDFCPIGSMQIGQHIWTTQYHPEMPKVFMQALLGYLADKLDSHTMARAHASLQHAADVPLFGLWMAQFIEHARNTRP